MRQGAVAAVLILALAASTLADGFMTAPGPVKVTVRAGQMVKSPRQEALLVFDGETVQVVLKTYFRAGPKDVAWVIPVPAKPENVGAFDQQSGRAHIFAMLDAATAPCFKWIENRPKPPAGLFGGLEEGGDSGEVEKRVVVEASGTAGIFEWTALGASDAAKLIEWLRKNGYAVPDGAERVADRYVKDGWHWLAIKVRPEEAAREKTIAPHPITYTYRAAKLVYPLMISQLSADQENEILLYVLAKGRFAPENWGSGRISRDKLHRGGKSPSGTNYEAVFAEFTRKNQGHFLVTEFAANSETAPSLRDEGRLDLDRLNKIFGAPLPPREKAPRISGLRRDLMDASPLARNSRLAFLTRLRAIMTAGAMDRDIVLKPLERSWTVRSVYNFSVRGPVPAEATGEAMAAAPQ